MSVLSASRAATAEVSINLHLSRRDKVPSARMHQDLMRPINGLPHFDPRFHALQFCRHVMRRLFKVARASLRWNNCVHSSSLYVNRLPKPFV